MKTTGIVAFAFGAPDTIRSNQCIARIASNRARQLGGLVYTQLDISVEPDIEVEYTEEKPGNPPPTLRIARGAVQCAKRHDLSEFWIVAARPHLWRCKRDLVYAVNEAGIQIKVRVCKEVERYPEDEWFCLDSIQARTRSRHNFQNRELILKLMPMFLYKLIAS